MSKTEISKRIERYSVMVCRCMGDDNCSNCPLRDVCTKDAEAEALAKRLIESGEFKI